MVVAQIAYNHLNPVAKAKCDALIAVNLGSFYSVGTSNFVTAGPWADDFKSALGTGTSHYIDIPFSLDGTTTNNFRPESPDVVEAINTAITTLQNTNATLTDQAMQLRYLIHFVGDIQQPLHCSTAIFASRRNGDAGGNGFSLATNSISKWKTLHPLWDDGGGFLPNDVFRPLTTTGKNILNAKIADIEADYPYDYLPTSSSIPDPMTWAIEGWTLAQTVCYVGIIRDAVPSTNYLNTAIATTKQRMAVGGHRLADLLNTLYPQPPINLTSLIITNGNFRFTWSAVASTTYRVQWKQSLTDPIWTDLTSITPSTNSASFSETAIQTQRFYRVVQ